jgi:hypothetical protein
MAASQLTAKGQPAHGGNSWLAKVFELNPAGLNWPRAAMVLDVLLVPLVVFWAIGHQEYLLSAVFGLLFSVLAGLLAKRTAKAPPGQPANVPAQRETTAEQDPASRSGHGAEPSMGQAG